jgi:hypothetical protein
MKMTKRKYRKDDFLLIRDFYLSDLRLPIFIIPG